MAGGIFSGVMGLSSSIFLMFLFINCQGFTFPNTADLAMAPFTRGAGSTSVLMGALQMVFGAIASALVGLFFNGTAMPMVTIMASCSMLGLIILLTGRNRVEFKEKQLDVEAERFEMIEKL